MNSFNHYAYGAIGDWMYRSVAGLDTDGEGPGYKRIRIQPHIGKGLDHAAASLHTPYGLAESKWSRQNGRLTLDVTIPPNTTATVFLPAADPGKMREGESLLNEVPGLKVLGTAGGSVQVAIGSGAYHFTVLD